MASTGYNGNPNLAKAGQKNTFTSEQLIEYKRCMNDPVYFAEKYFRIIDVDKGLCPIKMYEFQKAAVQLYAKGRRKLALCCSRQIGKTTMATTVILHYALFNKDRRIALLANKGDSAREILSRIQLAFEYLPKWLQVGVKEWNKGSVEFENGSTIIAAASSSSAIRGKSMSMVYIDECAFVENWEEFSASVLPTLSSGKKTITIFTSTPNGLNHFYYYCQGAKAINTPKWNGYDYLETKWYEVPGRTEQWKESVLAELGFDHNKFEREYECSFQGSSGSLISANALRLLEGKDPEYVTEEGLKQYVKPIKNHRYVLIADPSEGKGLDFATFSIFDISVDKNYKQVCTYRSNRTTPTDFAAIINSTAILYNKAFVCVENNNMGIQVCSLLWDAHEYENLIRTENMGRGGKQITFTADKRTEIGVRTTNPLKLIGCAMLKLLIEQNQMTIIDKATIDELSSFIKKGASYQADEGKHDDTVTPLWLFGWMSQTKFWAHIMEHNVFEGMQEVPDDAIERMMSEMRAKAIQMLDSAVNPQTKYEVIDDEAWFNIESESDGFINAF